MIIIAMIIKLICKLFKGSNSSSSSLLLIDSCFIYIVVRQLYRQYPVVMQVLNYLDIVQRIRRLKFFININFHIILLHRTRPQKQISVQCHQDDKEQQKQAKNNIIHLQIAIKLLYHHCTVIIPIKEEEQWQQEWGKEDYWNMDLVLIYTVKNKGTGSLLYHHGMG